MKTLKITTIITGVIIALISLTANAADDATDKLKSSANLMIMENMGLDKAFEISLIENYLKEQELLSTVQVESKILIYDDKDELVYEGAANSEKAISLKQAADFLMEQDQISYYRLHNNHNK